MPSHVTSAVSLAPAAARNFLSAFLRGTHGGETGIRTQGPLARSTVFKTAAFDHSATSPVTLS